MTSQPVRFPDGARYDNSMGVWSGLAGDIFLDWLKPEAGLRWLDVGCGGGAFTELIAERCAPAGITGIDPSAAQLAFARSRAPLGNALFEVGDAMSLPFPDHCFDAAVMALVIFFVPDPARAVSEMVRIVRPGGIVASYAWNQLAGGSPASPIRATLNAMGVVPLQPPSMAASGMDALRDLWSCSGLRSIVTHEIVVSRTFASFDAFWDIMTKVDVVLPTIQALTPPQIDELKRRLSERLRADSAGRITYAARTNAITGRFAG